MVKVRALDERRQDAGAGPSSSLGNVIDAILEALAIEDERFAGMDGDGCEPGGGGMFDGLRADRRQVDA